MPGNFRQQVTSAVKLLPQLSIAGLDRSTGF
jgi:hypothetical protein